MMESLPDYQIDPFQDESTRTRPMPTQPVQYRAPQRGYERGFDAQARKASIRMHVTDESYQAATQLTFDTSRSSRLRASHSSTSQQNLAEVVTAEAITAGNTLQRIESASHLRVTPRTAEESRPVNPLRNF